MKISQWSPINNYLTPTILVTKDIIILEYYAYI